MTEINEETKNKLSELLMKIDGVKNYIFIKENGDIVTHNVDQESSDSLSSVTAFCGLESNTFGNSMDFSNFQYLYFQRKNHENFFIFPASKYYLGIIQHKDADSYEIAKNVSGFIHKLARKKSAAN